jgi:hypothetical protein
MDEFITTLRESQLEFLRFTFSSWWMWARKGRLEVIEAVSTCESLKELHIDDVLDVEEVEVLCENLVSHPILVTLKVLNGSGGTSGDGGDKGTEILCNMLKNNRTIKTLLLGGEPVKEIGLA